jgi:hypothetical protein
VIKTADLGKDADASEFIFGLVDKFCPALEKVTKGNPFYKRSPLVLFRLL